MLPKRWRLHAPAAPHILAAFGEMSPMMAQVLINRGLDHPDDAHRFLYVRDVSLHNPYIMPDMARAVRRIREALRQGQPIAVYGDFDADGVTSTTLLVQALRALGGQVTPYIPDRFDEGYGLNTPALLSLAEKGTELVITVDCGIRSLDEISSAVAAGLDMVITDHHSLGERLPEGVPVVNPKRPGSPEPMLAGVGVAFKLAAALLQEERINGSLRINGDSAPFALEDLLDLVAIGTVADMMPLNSLENRVLVRRGLDVINRAQRPGVRALLEVSGLEPGKVTASDIGFRLGPRINAAGRLEHAKLAYQLFSAVDLAAAQEIAQTLDAINDERKAITRQMQATVKEKLAALSEESAAAGVPLPPLIFAQDPDFAPGVVGLVAGNLVRDYYRPAVVLEQGEAESHASCRSIPEFDITAALDRCADLLVRHGGHTLAAGFTVTNDNIPALHARLSALAADALAGQTLQPVLDIDMLLDVHQVNGALIDELTLLEPTGMAMRPPVFALMGVRLTDKRTVGADGQHLKLKVARAGDPPLDAIAFNHGERTDLLGDTVDIAFVPEYNEFKGRRTLQLNVSDLRPHVPDAVVELVPVRAQAGV